MTDDTGSADAQARDGDDELPVYLPPGGPDSVPGFCDRLIAHLIAGVDEGEFTFEDVEVDESQGVWLFPVGGYDPAEDRTLTGSAPRDPSLPPGGYAEVAVTSTEDVRRAMRAAWGEPQIRTPRLVGASREPEGLLDYILVAVGFDEAETWDRGAFTCALVTGWDGEPRTSMLRQAMVVLPREYALGGMAVLAGDEVTAQDLLMHGEHLLELRRRVWVLSTLLGQGEVRVRGTALEASRFGVRRSDGTVSVWTFTDDGRALVLLLDPACAFVDTAPDRLISDHLGDTDQSDAERREDARLILISRLIDGVPDDLRELIAAPAETGRGEAAEHELEFRMLSGRALPVISGIAWFDAEQWRVPASLLEIGALDDLGMDDFGFARAIRRPFRLGAAFSPDAFARPGSDEHERIGRVFAACPHPEQPRPPEDERLGYGLPRGVSHDEIVRQIERVAEAWWDIDPGEADSGDDPFRIGGRSLGLLDDRTLRSVLAVADPWTVDVLRRWVDGLTAEMTDRWGTPVTLSGIDAQTGLERRSSVARVMRGTGLMTAPLWWVHGHAVLLLAGAPDPSYGDEPQAILVIARADAVLDLMRGTPFLELRRRARLLATVGALTSGQEEPEEITWDGPVIGGSDVAPTAVRGRVHTGDHLWVWHFTHDGHALLMSFPTGHDAPAPAFSEVRDLFSGLPENVLSLVVDRDSHGLFPVVLREEDAPAGSGLLDRARALPAARAVLWFDRYDWRFSDGMLRRIRPALARQDGRGPDTDAGGADPYAALVSTRFGVGQLLWAWVAGNQLSRDLFADPRWARHLFDRMPDGDEVDAAYARLGDVHERALTGSLNEFLDVAATMPGRRYVLDAALANSNPQHRREIALYLLERDVDAAVQLSHLTPINVLFENPTLDAGDLPVLKRLLQARARPGFGLGGPGCAPHPLIQLVERDVDDAEIVWFVEELLAFLDLEELLQPAGADGRSVIEVVEAGFPHGRARSAITGRLRDAADAAES